MKRFICVFLISALCLSFASCSVKNEVTDTTETSTAVTTTLPVPVIDSSTHSKEFKDDSGKVVYTVEVVVPHLEEFENELLKGWVNGLSQDIFNEACDKAESNIENAAKFMESRNSSTPWSRKIDFEVSFSNGRFLSFIIKEYFSMFGEETEPSLKSATFDVIKEMPCSLFDFSREVFSEEEVISIIADKYLSAYVSNVFFNSQELNDEQRQLVYDAFDYESFYLTSDGIGFYMSRYIFDPTQTGVFTCHYTWSEIAEVLMMPE